MWNRYKQWLIAHDDLGLRIDVSRMRFQDGLFEDLAAAIAQASQDMTDLEAGAIANPDEKRQVGHYWLRTPALAPTQHIRDEIEQTVKDIEQFAQRVHEGAIKPAQSDRFRHILHIGIGGSALGPQLVDACLHGSSDPMDIFFLDNTDPSGIRRVLASLGPKGLAETLAVVVSKSGGTKETRNAMLEAREAFQRAGLPFNQHAVAITQDGSALDDIAKKDGWLKTFPMWSWVGGRTSELSAVGLVPAALQGFDIRGMLDGARACDEITRTQPPKKNPAMMLAVMWLYAQSGAAPRNMVVLPYSDRLSLFSKYLQQLIMESLGKARGISGQIVHQGLTVFGNKGSTDQHAYVQQLREGTNNFFVTFVQVRNHGEALEVEPGARTDDFLNGFLLGTRAALFENDRESITITIQDTSARSLGMLIALFERAVGLYASLVGINAYHQPGVEAGKKAAGGILELQRMILAHLNSHAAESFSAPQLAQSVGHPNDTELVFQLLEQLAAQPSPRVHATRADNLFDTRYASTS